MIDAHETKPASNFADDIQHTGNGNPNDELDTPISGAFENWLLEYRDRLAKVLEDEPEAESLRQEQNNDKDRTKQVQEDA